MLRISQIGLAVQNTQIAAEHYTKIGFGTFDILEVGLDGFVYKGKPAPHKVKLGFSRTMPQIELIEAIEGDTPNSDFLKERGEGITHLQFTVDMDEYDEILDKLAKEHGVTITASGLQDVFRVNTISLLTGASHTIESVSGLQKYDLGQSGPASIGNYCIGDTVDECLKKIEERGEGLNSFRISMEALIADLGCTITRIMEKDEVITDDADVEATGVIGGIVKKGLVTGMTKIVDIETKQGIGFHGEKISKAFNSTEKAEGNLHEWFIKGVPEIHLKIRLEEIEAKSATVAQLVYRIPDVINCEPGYITVEKLGKLKFRTLPLHYYVEPHSFSDNH